MSTSYSVVVIVAALMLSTLPGLLACKLPGNITASCVPRNECRTYQDFNEKPFKALPEVIAFDAATKACNNSENVVCCAEKDIIRKKPEVAPDCLQDRLGDSHRHNGTYPEALSFIAFLTSFYAQNESTCGGSLITSDFVLTAAHCVRGADYVLVYISTINLERLHDDGGIYPDGSYHNLAEKGIIVHEHYNNNTKVHDIALLQLSEPVDFSLPNSPKPVCISSAKHYEAYLSEYKTLRTFGWGSNIHRKTTDIKQVVHLQYITLENCRKALKSQIENNGLVIDERVICTRTVSGHDAFKGFSGSPLMYRQNEVWFMMGLVSYGIRENNKPSTKYPSMHTSIINHGDWILENIKQAKSNKTSNTQ